MHDKTKGSTPDRCGNGTLQERRENHIGPEEVDRFARDPIVNIEFDREFVTVASQLDIEALG
jgi:hypothetical protein